MNSHQPVAHYAPAATDHDTLQSRINASWAAPIKRPRQEVDLDA